MRQGMRRTSNRPPQDPPEPVQRNETGAIDPTANVLALVDAAVTRINDLQSAEFRRIDQVMKLSAEFNEKLSVAEAKRIDAIRAVDVTAVSVASERASAQAAVLATNLAATSEALRALIAATAQAGAAQLQQLQVQMTDRISLLEKAQYEGKGRGSLSAPLLMVLSTMAGGLILFLVQLAIK